MEQRRNNTKAWIVGRGAHQSDRSNSNATLIYSKTKDELEAYTRMPSEERSRACTIQTPGRHYGGTGAQRATISGTGP